MRGGGSEGGVREREGRKNIGGGGTGEKREGERGRKKRNERRNPYKLSSLAFELAPPFPSSYAVIL